MVQIELEDITQIQNIIVHPVVVILCILVAEATSLKLHGFGDDDSLLIELATAIDDEQTEQI